jgi:hypothetical protein
MYGLGGISSFGGCVRFIRRWRFFEKPVYNNREKSSGIYAHCLLSMPPFFRGQVVGA